MKIRQMVVVFFFLVRSDTSHVIHSSKGNIIRGNYCHSQAHREERGRERETLERVMDDWSKRLGEYVKRREVGHFTGLYFLVTR